MHNQNEISEQMLQKFINLNISNNHKFLDFKYIYIKLPIYKYDISQYSPSKSDILSRKKGKDQRFKK